MKSFETRLESTESSEKGLDLKEVDFFLTWDFHLSLDFDLTFDFDSTFDFDLIFDFRF